MKKKPWYVVDTSYFPFAYVSGPSGWTNFCGYAKEFRTKREAETFALVLASKDSHLIGKLMAYRREEPPSIEEWEAESNAEIHRTR